MGTDQGDRVPACAANGHADFPVRGWVASLCGSWYSIGRALTEASSWDIMQWQGAQMTGTTLKSMNGSLEDCPLCAGDMLCSRATASLSPDS